MLSNYPKLKRAAYRSGIAMIGLGVLLSFGAVILAQFGFGMGEIELLPGESPVHTFVRFLVLGCMLCALGSSD
jgi:hypothetical protein